MKSKQINKHINKVAKQNHLSKDSVKEEMQKALDAAWESNDPEALKKQHELFPDGKPSVEEFIKKISEVASAKR